MVVMLLCRRVVTGRSNILCRSLCHVPNSRDICDGLMSSNKRVRKYKQIYLGPFGFPYTDDDLIDGELKWSSYLVRYDANPNGGSSIWWWVLGDAPPRVSSLNEDLKNMKPHITRPFIAQMLVYGALPNISTFSILIRYYWRQPKFQHLHYVLDVLDVAFMQMEALGVKANNSFYNTLMNGVCVYFGPFVGYQFLINLRSNLGMQVPLSWYSAIVAQFCNRKLKVDAPVALMLIHVLMEMKRQRIFPDDKIHKYLLRKRYHGGEGLLKAVGIGGLMFAEGIRIGAVTHECRTPLSVLRQLIRWC